MIITCLRPFEKLVLSKLQLYIEAQTTTQCFVCRNCKNTILVRPAEDKELLMYSTHVKDTYWFVNWSKRNVFDIHLKRMNPFAISVPCIKIANSELLFEQYILALNQDKYAIEIQNDDAIKHNRIFFDFMQRKFNRLDGLYLREKCLLIDTIMKDQLRRKSAAEIEKPNRETKARNKRKEVTSISSSKKLLCE